MNCAAVRDHIPLYYYGELGPEEEERVEHHLAGCGECRAELERQKRLGAALDACERPVPEGLAAECRHDLMRAVYRESAPAKRPGRARAWFQEFWAPLMAPLGHLRQPAAAVALLALGWFSARVGTAPKPQAEPAAAQDVIYSSVRSIQPDASGRVQIALDETRRRTVSGRLDDGNIRRLLLAAAREEDNPAVRVESMGILKGQPLSSDVRDVLLSAALHDQSAAVRMKAIEGLKPVAGDPQVRKVLGEVLLSDENPGVRIRTIDMLVEHRDDDMVGVLQGVVQRENNGYVRLKCERALKEMNASLGTF